MIDCPIQYAKLLYGTMIGAWIMLNANMVHHARIGGGMGLRPRDDVRALILE
jgi:hypothetical protein